MEDRGEDDDTNKEMVHIKEECKRGRATGGPWREEWNGGGKKEGKGGIERRFCESGRKEEDYEEGM